MRVIVYEVHSVTIEVDTTDKEEAAVLAEQALNASDDLDFEYSYTMDPDDWVFCE